MTPLKAARQTVDLVSSFVVSFHPRSLQPMLRVSYARELLSWTFIPVMLAGLQQGAMGIVLLKTFAGLPGTTERNLGFAVGTISAAAAIGNLTSTAWAALSWGHSKVRFIVWLMLGTSICVGLIALVPASLTGAWMMVLLVLIGWIFWSGVITIRTTVWRTNYPGSDRTAIAGRLASIQAIVLAISGFIIGWMLDEFSRNDGWGVKVVNTLTANAVEAEQLGRVAFRIIFAVLAIFGVIGALIYARVRLRGQSRLARAERSGSRRESPSFNPLVAFRVLNQDRKFRRYIACQFVLGTGNLMLFAPLALILTEQFQTSYLLGIMVTGIIPLILMPLTIPSWARLLARTHVISFRAVHSWTFVFAGLFFLTGSLFNMFSLIVIGSIILGIAFGGGVLAWNLGHQHFAPVHQDSLYMSVHVTLTGVRGIIGPYLGVLIYESLRPSGNGGWVFGVSMALTMLGAIGFVLLRNIERQSQSTPAPRAE